MDKCVEQLTKIKQGIMDKMNTNIEMDISHEQDIDVDNATRFSICKTSEGDDTVRNYCHIAGQYRSNAPVSFIIH